MSVRTYTSLIQTTAHARSIDPSFVAGIMNLESGGQPRAGVEAYALNTAGTWHNVNGINQGVGLMQVVPREAPNPVFAQRPSVGELLDPVFNISYGVGILADDLARCGTKEGAACAYFAGHCIPTGSSDGNATDFEYIARAMAAEQQFLDLNTGGGDMFHRMNGWAQWWEHRDLGAGGVLGGVMQVARDFPSAPAGGTLVLEVFLDMGSDGSFTLRDGDGFYAGQVNSVLREAQIIVVPDAARTLRFDAFGRVVIRRIGIVGYFG